MHLLPIIQPRPRLSLFPPKALLSRAPHRAAECTAPGLTQIELKRIVSEMLG